MYKRLSAPIIPAVLLCALFWYFKLIFGSATSLFWVRGSSGVLSHICKESSQDRGGESLLEESGYPNMVTALPQLSFCFLTSCHDITSVFQPQREGRRSLIGKRGYPPYRRTRPNFFFFFSHTPAASAVFVCRIHACMPCSAVLNNNCCMLVRFCDVLQVVGRTGQAGEGRACAQQQDEADRFSRREPPVVMIPHTALFNSSP